MTLTPEQIKRLLDTAAFASHPEESELFCDAVRADLAAYADLALAADGARPAAAAFPAIERHLRFCYDCREEYAALLAILSDDSPPPEVEPDWSRIPPRNGLPQPGLDEPLRALLDQLPQARREPADPDRPADAHGRFSVALPDVAEPLELVLIRAAGDERLLDGQITPVPAHLGGARLDLYDAHSFAAISSATLSGQGRFNFSGIAPGRYILTIASGDRQDLLLYIHPSFLGER